MIKAKISIPSSLLDEAFERIRQLEEVKQDAIAQFILDMIADVDPHPIGGCERWARRIYNNDPTKQALFDAMREVDHSIATGEPMNSELDKVEHLSMFADEEYEEIQAHLIERHEVRLGLREPSEMKLEVLEALPDLSPVAIAIRDAIREVLYGKQD